MEGWNNLYLHEIFELINYSDAALTSSDRRMAWKRLYAGVNKIIRHECHVALLIPAANGSSILVVLEVNQ